MSEPEVLHEWSEGDTQLRLVRYEPNALPLVECDPWTDGSWGKAPTDRAFKELVRLAATVKALREERELIKGDLEEALFEGRVADSYGVYVRAIDAAIARLASPSVPAVSAEEEP